MADDVKLTLGIDVEALQRSASAATNVLTQAFEKGIGANVLGNGLPVMQGPLPQQDSKNTLRGVIDALERIDRTLIVGFNSIAGGVYTGAVGEGAGGGRGGGGGAPGTPGLAPPTPKTGVPGGMFGVASHVLTGAGDLAAALMPSAMRMWMGGFYGTDIMGFVHNLVSQVPVAGRLLGAVTGPFHQVMQQNDEFKNLQYETFRDSGGDAMDSLTNLWVDDDYRKQFVNRYGFSRSETAQLVGSASRRGLGQGGGLEAVLNMQGQLGLGQETAETLGGFRRAGAQGKETEVLATAIGVAVATGLERGRWGEMLSMWQRAAQSSVDTDIAWKELASQQQFIGSLGARFRGDTPAAQSMDQALRQAASNTQSPLALVAAMGLTGGDFFAATARMARAAEQPDTELEGRIVDQLMGTPGVRSWLTMPDGPAADAAIDRIAGHAATFGHGLSQLKIVSILKGRKAAGGAAAFKPIAPEAVDIARQQVTGGAALPDTALGPRRSQAEAQRPSGISSIQGTGTLGPGAPDQLRQGVDARDWRNLPPAPTAFGSHPPGGSGPDAPGFSPMGSGGPSVAGEPAVRSGYGQYLSQGFGNKISGRAAHPGVDLAFPPGTAVTCPVDGVVEYVNRNGTGLEVGAAVHVRATDGTLWKLYHIDPATFPASLRVGQRIVRGAPLGRTFSFEYWKGPGGQKVRTHLHVGHVGANGSPIDPLGAGGVDPGSLTGGAGGASPASSGGAGSGAGGPTNVVVDVRMHVTHDPSGRPVVRTRSATPVVTSSPGQIVGGVR